MTTILVIFVLIRQGDIIYALNKLLTWKYHLHKNICIVHQNNYENKHILTLCIHHSYSKVFIEIFHTYIHIILYGLFTYCDIFENFDSRLPLKFFMRCQFKICRISRAIYLHYVTLMPMAMALNIFCSRHYVYRYLYGKMKRLYVKHQNAF